MARGDQLGRQWKRGVGTDGPLFRQGHAQGLQGYGLLRFIGVALPEGQDNPSPGIDQISEEC